MINDEIDNYIALYRYDLGRLCYNLCRNMPDAENLYQETWLKAIEHIKQYKKDKPFDKWLYSICVNTYKESLRKKKREANIDFQSNEEKDLFLSAIPDINDTELSRMGELYDAINKLPPKYSTVIILKYISEYSELEIAQILKIPAGTVKSRLYKARNLLKRSLFDNE